MATNHKWNDIQNPIIAPAKDSFTWDDQVPQLAARKRGKAHTWIVQTRQNGKTVRTKIGDVAEMPVAIARAEALGILNDLHTSVTDLEHDISLAVFADRFLADCQHQWKQSTLKAHRRCISAQITPVLGQITLAALGRQDVLKWRRELACAAGTKNRALAVLSSMVRHAELLGLRKPGDNPCAGLRRHQSDFKAEYLDADGFAALNAVLATQVDRFPRAVPCIRFLMLTGCRVGEAKAALWDQRDGARITLHDAKSGPKSIWIGKPARNLLAGLPKTGPGIFAGHNVRDLGKELTGLWKVVRTSLNRPKLRIHDLRHSFASVAVNIGYDLRIVGGLLGHKDIETTAGYAHLDKTRVAGASERVGRHLGRAFADAKNKNARGPKLLRGEPQRPSAYERFVRSKLSVPAFCGSEGLDQDAFRQGLIAWRIQNGGRS